MTVDLDQRVVELPLKCTPMQKAKILSVLKRLGYVTLDDVERRGWEPMPRQKWEYKGHTGWTSPTGIGALGRDQVADALERLGRDGSGWRNRRRRTCPHCGGTI